MQRRRQLIGRQSENVPSAYERVMYIGAENASPYIDTGIYLTGELQAEIRYYNNKKEAFLFGSRKSRSGPPYCNYNIDGKSDTCRFDYLSVYTYDSASANGFGNGSHDGEFLFTFKNRIGTLKGLSTAFESSRDYRQAEFPAYTDHTVLLFAVRTGGAVSLGASAGNLRIYSAKFWLGGIYANDVITGSALIRNFVPCVRKADNKPGMYDTVTNAFYTNAGSGEFAIPN